MSIQIKGAAVFQELQSLSKNLEDLEELARQQGDAKSLESVQTLATIRKSLRFCITTYQSTGLGLDEPKLTYPTEEGLEVGHWDCDKSPNQKCEYNTLTGSSYTEHCVHCGLPDERK